DADEGAMCERGARALGRGGRRSAIGVFRWGVAADGLRRVALALFGCGMCFAVEGHAADDARPVDGATVDGVAVDGAAVDGAAVDGAAVDGAAVDGAAVDGAAVDGAAVDGIGETAEPKSTEPSLVWHPEWRRFGWWNAAVLGAGAGTALVALVIGPDEADPRRWTWAV